MRLRSLSLAASLAILVAVSLPACRKEPTRWDKAAAAVDSAPATPAVAKIEGGKLNAFFPQAPAETSRVFTQEKQGFVEAQLKKNGAAVATLAISDTEGDDAAKKKFDGATERLAGSPLVTVGKNQSAVLVGRYQVKVSSTTMSPEERRGLLEKFDLVGLARL